MKTVWTFLILGFVLSPPSNAEIAVVKKQKISKQKEELRFMQNFDAKIRALEDYKVYYVEASEARAKAAQRVQEKSRDGLVVKLLPAKKKS